MMGEGASVAAIDPSYSATWMLGVVGRDIVKYATWSGIPGVWTALFARAIECVLFIVCVDSFRFVQRTA